MVNNSDINVTAKARVPSGYSHIHIGEIFSSVDDINGPTIVTL